MSTLKEQLRAGAVELETLKGPKLDAYGVLRLADILSRLEKLCLGQGPSTRQALRQLFEAKIITNRTQRWLSDTLDPQKDETTIEDLLGRL